MSLRDFTKLRGISCLTCSRRLEDNPKLLQCHHTFCEACLGLLLSTDAARNMVKCPVCQKTTPVSNGNISRLDTDVARKSKIQAVMKLCQLCTNCDLTQNNAAVKYCEICDLFMCRMCIEKHNDLKPTSRHPTFMVDDIRKGTVFLDNKIPCKNHSGDDGGHVCTLVCITCKKAICEECNAVVHGEHNVQNIKDYEEESRAQSESLKIKVDMELKKAKRRVESVKSKEMTASDYTNHFIGSIRERAAIICKEVRDRENVLIKEIEDHNQSTRHEYLEFRKEDERMLNQVESASELLESSTSCQFGPDTVAIRTCLTDRLQRIVKREVDETEYNKQLNKITREATQIRLIPAENKLLLGHINSIPGPMPVEPFDTGERKIWTLTEELPVKSPMQCLTATPDGKLIVGTKRTGIIMCPKSDPKVKEKPRTPTISDVSGLAFTSKGHCVARTRCNRISKFTANWERIDATFQTMMTKWTFFKRGPCGNLTVDGDDYVYVNHIRDRVIEVFSDKGGQSLRKIHCKDFQPMDILAMKSRKMLLVSSGNQCVRLVDECGCERKKFHKAGENVFSALRQDDSILLACVKLRECLLTIEHYSQDLVHLTTIICDQKIHVPTKNNWFALQESSSGDIVFCTSERLYFFSRSSTGR